MGITKTDILLYTSYVLAALAVWILLRCARSLLLSRYEPEIWGWLELSGGEKLPIRHWECVIGRSAASDAVLSDPSVARSHAALLRSEDGDWTLTDLAGKGSLLLGGKPVSGSAEIRHGDRLRLGSVNARFLTLSESQRREQQRSRTAPGRRVAPAGTLLLLTVFQLTALLQLCLSDPAEPAAVVLSFGLLAAAEWCCFFLLRSASVRGYEPETLAFFLTTVGFVVAASSVRGAMLKQSLLFLGALALFFLLGIWLRSLRRVRALRWAMGIAALGFLALTLLTSEAIWGAKNWLSLAGQSLQPSEFVKIAYIYAGSATLDRLFRRRNLLLFIVFSAMCVGVLGLMGDFGTALVFFVAFLVISYMRSGSFATVLLALSGAALAVMLVLTVRPYVAARFAGWGHAWEDPLGAGYQQVRAMSALAAGGLFGRGAGQGWLRGVVAADTDLVFGLVCEELGLIVGLCCVLGILLLALFAVRSASSGRSAYFVIASCAAATMYMTQMGLNVFGSMDVLPFTGVTFPFLSRGGSSLIACWGMLAFIKAGDTRPGGSFALGRAGFRSPAPGGSRREKPSAAKKKTAESASSSKKKPAEGKPAPKSKPASGKPAGAKAPVSGKAGSAKAPASGKPAGGGKGAAK